MGFRVWGHDASKKDRGYVYMQGTYYVTAQKCTFERDQVSCGSLIFHLFRGDESGFERRSSFVLM